MAVDNQHILDEIRRTAEENGGKPLGVRRFRSETGIKNSDWEGKHWTKWSEAQAEAGFRPNTPSGSISKEKLIEHVITLIRALGHFPTQPEWRIRSRRDANLPSDKTIRKKVGRDKYSRAKTILGYCRSREGYDDVIRICEPIVDAAEAETESDRSQAESSLTPGFVYLMRSGNFYKIGRSESPGRREYDLGTHRPEGIEVVHTIKTDDTVGIEAYWHNRFRDQRTERGEWFDLTREDVQAFKRRKFM